MKTLTIAELMERADDLKSRGPKKEIVEVKGVGAIELTEPSPSLMSDALKISDSGDADGGDAHLLAGCITAPSMKDPALLAKFGVPTPDELVRKLFRQGDRNSLAKRCLSLGGYDGSGVAVVGQLKN